MRFTALAMLLINVFVLWLKRPFYHLGEHFRPFRFGGQTKYDEEEEITRDEGHELGVGARHAVFVRQFVQPHLESGQI